MSPGSIHRVPRLAASLVLVALSADVAAAGVTSDLDLWLATHAEDAAWIEQGSYAAPRAWVEQTGSGVSIVLKLPSTVTADSIYDSMMDYQVWSRTSEIETSFLADGAFFTGSRVSSYFCPTIATFDIRRDGPDQRVSWWRMDDPPARVWLDSHRAEMAESLDAAGIDWDVDDYIAHIKADLGHVAEVRGSHQFRDGWFFYRQEFVLTSTIARLAQTLGGTRQAEMTLKAACYSSGQLEWAGPRGSNGAVFSIRGNRGTWLVPAT